MKKRRIICPIALLLCLTLLLSGSAMAAVLGSNIDGYSVQLTRGVTLKKNVYWTGSDYRAENYVELAPGAAVYPKAVSRDLLCSNASVTAMASELEAQGLRVLAGVNGDYFNMSTLAPVGVVISDGVLRSSCSGVGAVGFREDGSVLLGRPELDIRLETGEESYRVAGLNKAAEAGIGIFTEDYAAKIGIGEDASVLLCGCAEDFRADCDVPVTAEEWLEAEKSFAVPSGKIALCFSGETEWLEYAQEKFVPGMEFHVTVSCAEGWEEIDSAVGSLYKLVTGGVREEKLEKTLNPRTAVGVKEDGTLVLYTVDGRQSGYSVGASMEQLADRLIELGCVEAGVLDGGGSTTLGAVMPGNTAVTTVNSPSEGKARQVVNAIFLVSKKAEPGYASRLVLYPLEGVKMLRGASASLTAKAVDSRGLAAALPETVQYFSAVGSVRDGVFYGTAAGSGQISAYCGELQNASVPVAVVETPDELKVYGERYGKETRSLTLEPGQEVDLTAAAWTNHVRLISEDACFTWTLEPAAGTVDGTGHLIASAAGGEGILTVSAGSKKTEIPITVLRPVPFEDVDGDAWYYDAVKFVYENGLFSGTGEKTFSPNDTMSRAMLVTVLWRMAGKPESGTAAGFSDVAPDAWYAAPVAWAAENGVVNGVSEDQFAPDAPLTREQTAALLYRYNGIVTDSTAEIGSLEAFPDGDSVSAWALDSMGWATHIGLIKGREESRLMPTAELSRAEAAAILMRYMTE